MDPLSSLRDCLIMHQVNILIFQGSPQALCKYVVHASPPAIHADINPIILDSCGEGGAGKLGPLIAIEDFQAGDFQFRSGFPVYQPGVHGDSLQRGHQHQYGWPGPGL